jgi:drug/metabolite transporter (DMT)-like permease
VSSAVAVAEAAALPTSAPSASRAERRALVSLVAGAVLIGSAPICVKLSTVGPSATAFWRLALAAPILLAWSRAGAASAPALTRREQLTLIVAGLFFAADLAFWHASLQLTSVALATLIANLCPVFVAAGERVFFGRRLTGAFLLGLTIALSGMAALVTARASLEGGQVRGHLLALVAASLYAGYLLLLKALGPRVRPAQVLTWTSASSCLALLPVAVLSKEALWPRDLDAWLPLLGLALVSQVLGHTLITRGVAGLPASFSAVTLLLQPVVAAWLAYLLLSEPLTAGQALAGALVLLGIALARRGSRAASTSNEG